MAKKETGNSGRPPIPEKVKIQLWTSAAGRCQFDNCNKPLWRNELTMGRMNASYIAHIYAFSENGPRYDADLSPKLEKDFSNLMLVCDVCHRTFDDKELEGEYPASRLQKMKKDHEDRIELLTAIQPDKKSHIILYGARIGEHTSPLHFKGAVLALLPDYYPVKSNAIELSLKNSSFNDADDTYWIVEAENLKNLFREHVAFTKANDSVQHYSVFALAPQPLLIMLGTLLNDIYPANIYQLHREPATWNWLEETEQINYLVTEPVINSKKVALKIALSASVSDDRITSVLSDDAAIWMITIPSPHNDFLRSRTQLQELRRCFRQIFDNIKSKHGEDAELHIFPAMPVAAAVEFGRVWMPKADLAFTIYEQNRAKGGFFKTLKIE
ncbi:SAVED domain-containing protein [Niabella beijingensis]|uniref:SAVED domain-containing protein n=1 Tax=Niabella beijingensis TaxID=2872700 RepID=UPI001CBE84C4|nr:SAVED domain-containing protein [Niabella beijingensis]MBZ4187686.1 SAVED domain-containing protein [Niabella beijingensis]